LKKLVTGVVHAGAWRGMLNRFEIMQSIRQHFGYTTKNGFNRIAAELLVAKTGT
jgi:hypothetical protein